MKIAIDPQIFSIQAYGGISRYFINLSRELRASGLNVRTFAPLHRNEYLAKVDDGSVSGRYWGPYPPRTTRPFLLVNQALAARRIAQWKPDIVHESYYSRIRWTSSKSRSVVTVYDMIHELYPQYFSRWDSTVVAKKKAVMRADHVLCISESTRNDLLNLYGIEGRKVSVTHLGYDVFLKLPENGQIVGHPYILYVGQRGRYKNFERFVRAFASSDRLIRDFSLVAFGGGAFSKEEKDFFVALKLKSENCHQISGGDELLGQLYRNAACFVYPSLYEGFGLPPLEAMSVDCPVVSSNTSSMPEVIGDAAEFFDPVSVESILMALEKVVYSPSRSQDLIDRGRRRVKLFTWKKCAEKTIEAYRQCL